jgi:hypothetical protein
MFNSIRFISSRVSLSTQAKDLSNNEYVTLGINLSDGIYNDKNDISMENAIW